MNLKLLENEEQQIRTNVLNIIKTFNDSYKCQKQFRSGILEEHFNCVNNQAAIILEGLNFHLREEYEHGIY